MKTLYRERVEVRLALVTEQAKRFIELVDDDYYSLGNDTVAIAWAQGRPHTAFDVIGASEARTMEIIGAIERAAKDVQQALHAAKLVTMFAPVTEKHEE